jgi:hypothetical protein
MSEAKDKDGDALDSYLSGDSELSRRYRNGRGAQPSASVDRAILDAAREEAAEPASRRGRSKLRWERPLAIAAAVMLSTILVVSIQRESGLFPPEYSEAEQSLDHRNDAARPVTGGAQERPAAPQQEADTSVVPRVLSDPPARSDAARSAKGSEAEGVMATDLLKQSAEPEPRSPPDEDRAIREALARIDMAWKNGEAERAQQLLQSFREDYPQVSEERLREALPEPLLRP